MQSEPQTLELNSWYRLTYRDSYGITYLQYFKACKTTICDGILYLKDNRYELSYHDPDMVDVGDPHYCTLDYGEFRYCSVVHDSELILSNFELKKYPDETYLLNILNRKVEDITNKIKENIKYNK